MSINSSFHLQLFLWKQFLPANFTFVSWDFSVKQPFCDTSMRAAGHNCRPDLSPSLRHLGPHVEAGVPFPTADDAWFLRCCSWEWGGLILFYYLNDKLFNLPHKTAWLRKLWAILFLNCPEFSKPQEYVAILLFGILYKERSIWFLFVEHSHSH